MSFIINLKMIPKIFIESIASPTKYSAMQKIKRNDIKIDSVGKSGSLNILNNIQAKTSDAINNVTISPTFKLIFNVVLILTLASLTLAIIYSFIENPNDRQISIFELTTTSWKIGFGAIVGLLGGKSF